VKPAPRFLRAVALATSLCSAACTHSSERALTDVRRGDLVLGVEVTGELEAVDSLVIRPPAIHNVWDFKITSLAPEGVDIKAGDPLVSFDPSELTRSLEAMAAEADTAQKKLEKKRDEAALARREDEYKVAQAEAALRKAKLKTESSDDAITAALQQKLDRLDTQRTEVDLAAATNQAERAKRADDDEIKRLADAAAYAKHRVDEITTNVGRMTVLSPRAGTIVYPTGDQAAGEKHKVGDSVWIMSEVIDVVGLGKMITTGQIDEVDMARVAERQPATLRLDAIPDAQLHGHVVSIAKSVTPKSDEDPSKRVKLKIELDPTTIPLRPGMRLRGQIETETLHQVVIVPADAVFVTVDGPVAYREHAGRLERIAVVLGKRSATAIEVRSGLSPGDRVSRVDPEAR
jgi:HlyD family secretion protein